MAVLGLAVMLALSLMTVSTASAKDLWTVSDIAVDGTGSDVATEDGADSLTLDLTVSGSQTGELRYHNSRADEAVSLTGSWNGKPAGLPRSAL